jgi:hypothetical protein
MIGYSKFGKVLLLVALSLLTRPVPNLLLVKPAQTTSQGKPAACHTYAVRRIEFIGNQNTRDRIVRRRIAFSESKTLTEKDIEQTIKNLNRLKRLEKLKREDIEITYAEADPAMPDWHCFADILIHVKEKKRR